MRELADLAVRSGRSGGAILQNSCQERERAWIADHTLVTVGNTIDCSCVALRGAGQLTLHCDNTVVALTLAASLVAVRKDQVMSGAF